MRCKSECAAYEITRSQMTTKNGPLRRIRFSDSCIHSKQFFVPEKMHFMILRSGLVLRCIFSHFFSPSKILCSQNFLRMLVS